MHLIHLKGECPKKSQISAGVKICKQYQGQHCKGKGWKKMRNTLIADTTLTRNWARDFALKCKCMAPLMSVSSTHHKDKSTANVDYPYRNSLIDLSTPRKQKNQESLNEEELQKVSPKT